jgi:hypothetical protein
MGLIDRVLGLDEPAKCPMHPRAKMPCRQCQRMKEQARGFQPETRTKYGPRGGKKITRTGNRVDGAGNVWCGACDCRILNNRCTNARCSTRSR